MGICWRELHVWCQNKKQIGSCYLRAARLKWSQRKKSCHRAVTKFVGHAHYLIFWTVMISDNDNLINPDYGVQMLKEKILSDNQRCWQLAPTHADNSFTRKVKSLSSLYLRHLEATAGLQFYRICCLINDLKYPSMSAPMKSCIFGKLASCIIRV